MHATAAEPQQDVGFLPALPDGMDHRVRVLAAEDNAVYRTLLRAMLTKWGYDVVMAHDGTEAWQILQSPDAPRLAILDWMMPGLDGVEICRRVRSAGREPYIYILLLTSRTESQDLVAGMDAGADDYLLKTTKPPELRVRLRAGRRIIDLQEKLVRAREALREQATHDSLTGLLNRASILEHLQDELARAGRQDQPLCLLMVDLDHFKSVNDTYGHLAGDAVLREAARRMKAAVRRYDAIGRYGGEEFLIVLSGCEREDARARAERIRAAVAAEPFAVGAQSIQVTTSIGVACCAVSARLAPDALVRNADLAVYQAKSLGRNYVAGAGCAPQDPAVGL